MLSWPSSFNLFCWADHVVNRCAVRVVGDAAAAAWRTCGSTAAATPTSGRAAPRSKPSAASLSVQQEAWVLAPVLAAVPPELRNAVLSVRLQQAEGPAAGVGLSGLAAGAKPLPYLRVRNSAPLRVVVSATCAMRAGTHLTPLLLLPSLDCEEIMAVHGPEGLVWRRLLLQQGHADHGNVSSKSGFHACGSSSSGWAAARHGSSVATAGSATAAATAVAASGHAPVPSGHAAALGSHASPSAHAPAAAPAAGLPHHQLSAHLLYELYICPSEEDMLCEEKLRLLAASGLGCVHYISEGLTTEDMVAACLKICLAGTEVLGHPLALKCIQLHAALLSAGAGDAGDAVGVGPPAPPGAGSSAAAAEGVAGGSDMPAVAGGAGGAEIQEGGSHGMEGQHEHGSAAAHGAHAHGGHHAGHRAHHQDGPDLPQQLCMAQAELVAMLARLPEDHPVSRAARKQFRQMVHDARKNTRRRLRQLEAVHAHAAAHPSAKGVTAVSPLGGGYSPLGGSSSMHEGVRLYLQALCTVLDDCAERLGLNRQSDSLRGEKRSSK